MADSVVNLSKSIGQNAEAFQNLFKVLNQGTKLFEKTRKEQTEMARTLAPMFAGNRKLTEEFKKQFPAIRKIDKALREANLSSKDRLTIMKTLVSEMKRNVSEEQKLINSQQRRIQKIEVLKARLKDEGVATSKVINFNNLRKQAIQGNVVAMDRLNRRVTQAIAAERKHQREIAKTSQSINSQVRSFKELALVMSGVSAARGKGDTGTSGILGVRNTRNIDGMGSSFSVLRSKLLLASFAFGLVNRGVVRFVELAGQQEAAEKRVTQAIISTGLAAGLSTTRLRELASEMQNITTFGDEAVLASSALLLTFKDIAGDTFIEAQKTILDVSVAMGQDLKTSTIQVGKALNDPVKGLTALQRVGIQFNAVQKSQIKGFVQSNQVAKAQAIIIKELNSQFGGMAEALSRTAEGSLLQMNNALGDLGEEIGKNLAPLVLSFANAIKEVAEDSQNGGRNLEFYIETLASLTIGFGLSSTVASSFSKVMAIGVAGGMTTATAATNAFRIALMKTGIGLVAVGLGFLATKLSGLSSLIGTGGKVKEDVTEFGLEFRKLSKEIREIETNAMTDKLQNMQDALATSNESITFNATSVQSFGHMLVQSSESSVELSKALAELSGKTTMSKKEYDKYIMSLQDDILAHQQKLSVMREVNHGLSDEAKAIAAAEEAYRNSIQFQLEILNGQVEILRALAIAGELNEDQIKGLIELEERVDSLMDKLAGGGGAKEKVQMGFQEMAQMAINSFSSMTSAQEANMNAREQMALDELKSSKKYANANAKTRKDLEKSVTDDFKSEKEKAFKANRNVNIANATMNAYSAITAALDDAPIPFNYILAAAVGAMAFKQVQAIATTPMPKFATGGDFITSGPQAIMVGDNPGGRERVQVTPLSSPNIDGPQGGSVNVTFSGNVMSQDFIEDEAIPLIKEAIRRGADIGVS